MKSIARSMKLVGALAISASLAGAADGFVYEQFDKN